MKQTAPLFFSHAPELPVRRTPRDPRGRVGVSTAGMDPSARADRAHGSMKRAPDSAADTCGRVSPDARWCGAAGCPARGCRSRCGSRSASASVGRVGRLECPRRGREAVSLDLPISGAESGRVSGVRTDQDRGRALGTGEPWAIALSRLAELPGRRVCPRRAPRRLSSGAGRRASTRPRRARPRARSPSDRPAWRRTRRARPRSRSDR
jgi:hypothetical protein